jgi:hypothetical protein
MYLIDKELGYYTVDGLEFDSKIQACLYANDLRKEVKWHFNNEAFESYDWKNEPDESIDSLYDKRAKELREKYDYIIVSYSGGADSHNLVMSFLRQGLLIDEIVVNTMSQITNKIVILDPTVKNAENAAAEHELQTVPRLKESQKASPNTKITILDLSDFLLNSWLKIGDARWIIDKREGLNPLNVTRFNYIHFNDVRNRFDKHKTIALVLGVEKPRVTIGPDNGIYISFSDRASNIVTVAEHLREYTNSKVEYFYWSPNSIDILCKQAHIIKRWLEHDEQRRHLWYKENATSSVYRLYHERLLRTIIYTTWNDNWYQVDKATKDWYSEFDSWFVNGFKGTKQHDIWLEGLRYVQKNAENFVRVDNGVRDGLKIFAHYYFVDYLNSPTMKS